MGYSHIIHRIQVLVSMLAEETGITHRIWALQPGRITTCYADNEELQHHLPEQPAVKGGPEKAPECKSFHS